MRGEAMPPWAWELWILAFWWGAWSLADVYLLPYSPAPELIVLGACAGTLGASVAQKNGWWKRLETELAAVTQTNYGKHVDAIEAIEAVDV